MDFHFRCGCAELSKRYSNTDGFAFKITMVFNFINLAWYSPSFARISSTVDVDSRWRYWHRAYCLHITDTNTDRQTHKVSKIDASECQTIIVFSAVLYITAVCKVFACEDARTILARSFSCYLLMFSSKLPVSISVSTIMFVGVRIGQ